MDTIHNYEDAYWEDVAKRNAKYSAEKIVTQMGCDFVELYCENGSNRLRQDIPDDVRRCLYNAYHILQEVDRKMKAGEPYETEAFNTWKKKGGRRA